MARETLGNAEAIRSASSRLFISLLPRLRLVSSGAAGEAIAYFEEIFFPFFSFPSSFPFCFFFSSKEKMDRDYLKRREKKNNLEAAFWAPITLPLQRDLC
jgi:hypothetical protein